LRFDRISFILALALLATEVLIALFVRNRFVRPYVGDVLVVMLIFFAVRAVWPVRAVPLAIGVLCFAVAVEATQAMGLIEILGWSDNTLAKLVMGNTFQWGDLVCYLIGSVTSLCIIRIVPTGRQAP
jgi:hypothetical protein